MGCFRKRPRLAKTRRGRRVPLLGSLHTGQSHPSPQIPESFVSSSASEVAPPSGGVVIRDDDDIIPEHKPREEKPVKTKSSQHHALGREVDERNPRG